ncbi:DEAD/DEAH box helicase [Lactobacillus delbrueckii]|uniref:DEAD/DEAH box helicase n=1 Tax=Lactobacillus delbrueckii TaxID=1584 RepID=UPI001F23A4D3|nr:DEAD/DEAH box helicase [Lactobacillus delbrueckii]
MTEARQELAQKNKGVMIVSPPGSGKSVVIAEIARLTALKGNRILFFVHRRELTRQIEEAFINNGVDMSKVIIDTVQRVWNHIQSLEKPSLIIIDEAHHSKAKTYKKILEYWPDVPRLGFTATPWRMSGEGFTDEYSSMVEGPQVQWLIDHNRLAPYDYYAVPLGDFSKLASHGGQDYTGSSMNEYMETVAYGDLIGNWKKHAGGRQTICYTPTVATAREVVQRFQEAGISAAEADGKTPTAIRDEVMEGFKSGKYQVLVNCDLVSEGFNVPECSCVILLRPTKSLVLYLQQAMRCMRYQPDKRAIILDHVNNWGKFGLPNQDRDWTLKSRKRGKSREGGSEVSGIYQCSYCMGVFIRDENIVSETDEVKIIECPYCGEQFEIKNERKDKELGADDGMELKKIQGVTTKDFEFTVENVVKLSDCNTIPKLQEYAKQMNYKPGWVYYQAKARHLI